VDDGACIYREVRDNSPACRARWRQVVDSLLAAADEDEEENEEGRSP
jgi:hypothetical protein